MVASNSFFNFWYVPTHIMSNANEVIHCLENFLMSTNTWLRPFHNDGGIFLILWFTEHGQILLSSVSQELHGYLLPPNLGILLVEIHGQTWGCSLFCPVCWGPTREVNLFRLSFFQESFTVVDLSSSIDSYRYLSFLPPFLPGHIFYRGCCAHGPLRHHSTILP